MSCRYDPRLDGHAVRVRRKGREPFFVAHGPNVEEMELLTRELRGAFADAYHAGQQQAVKP